MRAFAGPVIEHRDFGILAISGPGIRKDELLHGPYALDITPAILTLFGLLAGECRRMKAAATAKLTPLGASAVFAAGSFLRANVCPYSTHCANLSVDVFHLG
jgi:hypothetical protein